MDRQFLADSRFLPIFFLCRSSSSYGVTAIWLQLPEAGAILEIVLHSGLPFHNEHSGRFWLTRYQATVFWVIRPTFLAGSVGGGNSLAHVPRGYEGSLLGRPQEERRGHLWSDQWFEDRTYSCHMLRRAHAESLRRHTPAACLPPPPRTSGTEFAGTPTPASKTSRAGNASRRRLRAAAPPGAAANRTAGRAAPFQPVECVPLAKLETRYTAVRTPAPGIAQTRRPAGHSGRRAASTLPDSRSTNPT